MSNQRASIPAFAFMIVLALAPTQSGAVACSTAGLLQWRGDGATNAMMFCDGANWQSTDQGSTLGACSTAGIVTYDAAASPAATYKFCDGTSWKSMKGGSVGTCTDAGNFYFNGISFVFCDGTTLWNAGTGKICIKTICASGLGCSANNSGSLASYTLPADFGAPNVISVIGGGGGGLDRAQGSGGAGGSYNQVKNVGWASGSAIWVAAGSAGAAATSSGVAGGDSYICTSNSCTVNTGTVVVGAKGGPGGSTGATAPASISLNFPASSGFSGGGGSAIANSKGGGGGGAAGPSGAGVTSTTNAGGAGDNGSGGAGGSNGNGSTGGAGLAGNEWGTGIGSGGGGTGSPNAGGNGGNFGGGGAGSGGSNKSGGSGGPGLIVLTYTSNTGVAANQCK